MKGITADMKWVVWAAWMMVMALVLPCAASSQDDTALMQKIRRHIEQNMIWSAENVRLEFLTALPKTEDLKGKITYSIESRSREEYIGDTSFNVRIFSNGIFSKEENVRVRIEVLREFVVSLNSINKDSIISASDVVLQKKWVRSIPMNAISSLDDAVGKNMVVSVRPNTMVTRSMIKEVMPVRKGKMVQVILDSGSMKMMMNGVAEEDGSEDALIRIRNISSNKIIYGRVIGQGKVQVDF